LVTVSAGSAGATFTVTAGTFPTDQTAIITATLNGSTQTTVITLATAPVQNVSLGCDNTALAPGATTGCTLAVSGGSGGWIIPLAVSGDGAGAVVPASITIPAGTNSANFFITAPNATGITFQITASLGSSTQSVTFSVGASAISSLSCSPDANNVGTLLCTIQLAQAAPLNGATVFLQSSSSRVQVPNVLVVPAGSQSATFAARVSASDQDEQPQITASVQGAVRTTAPMIIGIRPTGLTCSTQTVQGGNWFDCEVQLNSSNVPEVARLVLASANPDLKIPAVIATRPGQTRITFKVYADPLATQRNSSLTVQFGATAVNDAVSVTPASAPVLSIPQDVATVFGKQVSATVSAADPTGLTVVLSASGLPDGASFEPGTGRFSWTPTQSQQGNYSITFTATNSAHASSTGHLAIVVDSGKPVITGIYNAASLAQRACSPGSIASLTGRWLAAVDTPMSNPSGTVTELGGTRVRVNGGYVSVVYASASRVDFVCPGSDPGTLLTVAVENAAGTADPVSTNMYRTAPGLYSADGAEIGQGQITLAGTSLLATSRDYLALGQPAEAGDSITIRATGMASLDGALPIVKIGDFYAQARSMAAVPGVAGVYEITVQVPLGIPEGDAIPVVVCLPPDPQPQRPGHRPAPNLRGFGLLSNPTMIAAEQPRL